MRDANLGCRRVARLSPVHVAILLTCSDDSVGRAAGTRHAARPSPPRVADASHAAGWRDDAGQWRRRPRGPQAGGAEAAPRLGTCSPR